MVRTADLSTEELFEAARACVGDPLADIEPPFLDYLCALLHRPEPAVFERAREWCRSDSEIESVLGARVLGALGVSSDPPLPFRDESLAVVRPLLADPRPLVVAGAVQAIGRLGGGMYGDDQLVALVPLARHEAERVRLEVAIALWGCEAPRALATLIELSKDVARTVRDWATCGLGSCTDADTPEIRRALWNRRDDPDWDTRCEAQLGLARRGDARAIPLIRAELARGNDVGTLTIEAAEELRAPELLPALLALRDDRNESDDRNEPVSTFFATALEAAIRACGGSGNG